MTRPRYRLASLVCNLVVLTLLVAFGIASLVLALGGNWEKHSFGLTISLKIMWGVWLLVFASVVLTRITVFGWQFRRVQPGQGPPSLSRALAQEMKPSSWLKTTATSFTITVVLVSLMGTAVLASVLIWVIGDWSDSKETLVLSLKIIWGTWWVLCIATVLVRVKIFDWQRMKAGLFPRKPRKGTVPPAGPSDSSPKDTSSTLQ
jgi:hypothetical protein